MAGIYHNATLGLISLSSDGENWVTIADKNLGATTVYNDGDTLSEANSGKYYQWGNNYGFPFTGSVTTSSTRVDATNYGPGNYYSNSTFITSNIGWDSSNNTNLWGGVTGTNAAMQGPCPNGYHIPSEEEIQKIRGIRGGLHGSVMNAEIYQKALKMPPTGAINNGGSISGRGSNSLFRGTYHNGSGQAIGVGISDYGGTYGYMIGVEYANTSYGKTIRPFKNEAVIPDYNDVWDTLYGDELPNRPSKLKWLKNGNNYYYFDEAPTHISSITLNTSSITFNEVGATYQLIATVSPSTAVETKVSWSSSDESVAIVDSNGLVTCVSVGQATITASCDGRSATCGVDYTHVTGVTLNTNSIQLTTAGQTYQLVATVNPSGAYNKNVTWSSSNTNIATVDANGLVTCVTPGTCTITVTTEDGGYTANCNIKNQITVSYYLVGGGGSGGGSSGYSSARAGGGGGAGGVIYRSGAINTGSYTVTIGGGGTSHASCSTNSGGNSTFAGYTAYGGGAGGSGDYWTGANGGSGGGGAGLGSSGASGCTGQGNNGGSSYCGFNNVAGGGSGRINGVGGDAGWGQGGAGGAGCCISLGGGVFCFGAGGGGGVCNGTGGAGGQYGGGTGSGNNGQGGDATSCGSGGGGGEKGGNGTGGMLLLYYLSSCGYNITGGTCYTCGDYTIHLFTSGGTLTVSQ